MNKLQKALAEGTNPQGIKGYVALESPRGGDRVRIYIPIKIRGFSQGGCDVSIIAVPLGEIVSDPFVVAPCNFIDSRIQIEKEEENRKKKADYDRDLRSMQLNTSMRVGSKKSCIVRYIEKMTPKKKDKLLSDLLDDEVLQPREGKLLRDIWQKQLNSHNMRSIAERAAAVQNDIEDPDKEEDWD